MPNTAWKAVERRIAADMGAKRRGADFRNPDGGGKSDLTDSEPFSVEIKHRSKPSFTDVREAINQARTNAETGECPVAIIVRKGQGRVKDHDNKVVAMAYQDFLDWFGAPDARERLNERERTLAD